MNGDEGVAGTFTGFAIALLIGVLVGVEREHKRRTGELGTGGLRTFVLIAEAGALAAWMARALESAWIFAAMGALVAALLVAGYLVQTRVDPRSIGLTTEVSALIVYLLGGAAAAGQHELAVALAIATSAVLAFKEPMHGLVERLGRDDIEAGLKLLIASFIVLPVLPNRAIDPWGVLNPYEMWLLVVLISALSLAGYAATRALGPERGLALTGIAGGLVSSTAVTLGFARQSRERGAAHDALAAGLLLAWAVMFGRIAVEVAVVHRPLLARLAAPLGLMALGALVAAIVLHPRVQKSGTRERRAEVEFKNPFRLMASIRFALLFTLVLLAVELARRRVPESGLYLVAGFAGLTDVDAITLSMAKLARGGGDASVAAGSIVTAALSNTVVKCALVAVLGARSLARRVVVATAVLLVTGIAALLFL